MSKDKLGDFFKKLESEYRQVITESHLIVRLDGKCFSSFTKGLIKPFDEDLMNLFKLTVTYLAEKYNATLGYSQSDEISLYWNISESTREHIFGGKCTKINSILASDCTLFFNQNLKTYLPKSYSSKNPLFDCRCFGLESEYVNKYFRWRQRDCYKNAITLIASKYYSHKELLGKNTQERIEMIPETLDLEKSKYLLSEYLYGITVERCTESREFTFEEIESLPEKHDARLNPSITRDIVTYKLIDWRF